jgi:hypothetical protein
MTDHARPRIAIDDEHGRPIAGADIEVVGSEVARASLHVESGHLPSGTRERLVDAVLDAPEVRSSRQVQVALPLGETEILERVRERCDTSETRAAGSTALVDAELPDAATGG